MTEEKELHAIIINYQKKAREMSEKIGDLEKKLEAVSSSDDQKSSEKSRSAKNKEKITKFHVFIFQIQTLGKKTEGREEHVQRHDGEAEQREQDAEGGGGEDEADDREVEGSVQESEE